MPLVKLLVLYLNGNTNLNLTQMTKKEGWVGCVHIFKPVLILTSRARAVFDSVAPDSIEDINILSPNSDHSGVLVHTVLESAFNRGCLNSMSTPMVWLFIRLR